MKRLYCCTIACALTALPTQEAQLAIVEPTTATRLVGPVVLSAEVTGGTAKEVQFVVDGAPVCRTSAAPFQCHWDAGSSGEPRTVRVVAVLADGHRLVSTVRTAGSTALFHSSSEVIQVAVRVTDKRGQPLTDLAREDFEIREDGKAQQLALFSQQETPCSILIALDVSGSMAPNMDRLKSAVHGFLGKTRPQDLVTLATFSTDLNVVSGVDATVAAKQAAVNALRAGGGTALYDVMAYASNVLKRQPGPRALVMFTDGEDVSSRSTVDGARAALHGNDVTLYLIAQGKLGSDAKLKRQLSSLADETGGEAFFTSNMNGVSEHFFDILSKLSRQYLLGYAPVTPLGDGAWRRIEVTVTRNAGTHLVVHARAGYFATRRAVGAP